MAAITVAEMAKFNTAYAVTGVASNAGASHTIDISNIKSDKLQILIDNTSTAEGVVTFADGGFFSEDGQGDLAVTVAASTDVVIALESARFKASNGTVALAVTGSGFTSMIYASELP